MNFLCYLNQWSYVSVTCKQMHPNWEWAFLFKSCHDTVVCPSYVPATVLGVWDSSVNHMGEALALAEFPWAWI